MASNGGDLEVELVSDIADAVAMSVARDWRGLVKLGEELGWTADGFGWMIGRRFSVLFESGADGLEVAELYLPQGALTCSLHDPIITVCGGPPILPFPEADELLDEFDIFCAESGCHASDKPALAAAHRVLCAWFDLDP